MKIMLIEDDETKSSAISQHLINRGIHHDDIIYAKNMTDFSAKLDADIGLFIIDLKLPNSNYGPASLNGKAIMETLVKAGKHNALLLAISSYPDDFPSLREYFESHGCILAEFSKKEVWQSALNHLLIQLKKNTNFDFLVFCALQKERNPYTALFTGSKTIRGGVDCYDFMIGDKKGAAILLPQMGLVNAAVIASMAIDRFRPSVVGMSGICGGFKGRAQLGQLMISTMAYEYQSGKWASDGFIQEPYQVTTDHITHVGLSGLVHQEGLIKELEEGFTGTRPPNAKDPMMSIFTSGSAVIADKTYMEQIESIHRKVNALDMEVFSIQRAAQLSPFNPPCICAKTVVDLCDHKKNDELHLYGSHISAKFLAKAIHNFFTNRT